jgi:hypothetical protein
MTIHIHPSIRAREDAEQAAGLIVTLDSDGFIDLKNQENLGATFRQSPKATYLFNGNSYTPSTLPPNT